MMSEARTMSMMNPFLLRMCSACAAMAASVVSTVSSVAPCFRATCVHAYETRYTHETLDGEKMMVSRVEAWHQLAGCRVVVRSPGGAGRATGGRKDGRGERRRGRSERRGRHQALRRRTALSRQALQPPIRQHMQRPADRDRFFFFLEFIYYLLLLEI